MRLAAAAAVVAFLTCVPLQGQTVTAGGSPLYREGTVTEQGRPTTLAKISLYFHQMDLPPGSVQPIGLEEFFYILASDKTGNARHCATWVERVRADEAAWTKQDKLFPYLQIAIAPNARPVAIAALNGLTAWRDKDVLCWEAMDFGPPLY